MGNMRVVRAEEEAVNDVFGKAMVELAEAIVATHALASEKTDLLRKVSMCYSRHTDHVMSILEILRSAADITVSPDTTDSPDTPDSLDTGADTHST